MNVVTWVLLALVVLTPVLVVWHDPRTMMAAITTGFSGSTLAVLLLFWAIDWAQPVLGGDFPYVSLALVAFALLVVFAIAFFLIWAGLVLVKRERATLPHLLSLLLGVGILAYIAAVFYADWDARDWIPILVTMGFPIFVFSFLLGSYVVYSAVYGFIVRRWGRVGQATVVLGSGLIGDRVPPLLAHRVDLGVTTFRKAKESWQDPFLVFSGGKGSDELTSEAAAMNRYALEKSPELAECDGEILLEDRSTTTQQNLLFSRDLLDEAGCTGPWTTVTSNFHAFRAANLMSRLHIPGNAIGARTKSYFWASAKLREFVALLSEHRVWTGLTVVVTVLPLLSATFRLLFT